MLFKNKGELLIWNTSRRITYATLTSAYLCWLNDLRLEKYSSTILQKWRLMRNEGRYCIFTDIVTKMTIIDYHCLLIWYCLFIWCEWIAVSQLRVSNAVVSHSANFINVFKNAIWWGYSMISHLIKSSYSIASNILTKAINSLATCLFVFRDIKFFSITFNSSGFCCISSSNNFACTLL